MKQKFTKNITTCIVLNLITNVSYKAIAYAIFLIPYLNEILKTVTNFYEKRKLLHLTKYAICKGNKVILNTVNSKFISIPKKDIK